MLILLVTKMMAFGVTVAGPVITTDGRTLEQQRFLSFGNSGGPFVALEKCVTGPRHQGHSNNDICYCT